MSNYPDTKIYNTLPKILKHKADTIPDTVALRDKDLGIWNEITWKQYNDKVSYLALGLAKKGFKAGDVIALSDKLTHIFELDETTLKSMGNEGRKNVINKFNVDKMCFSTYSEYKKLIS